MKTNANASLLYSDRADSDFDLIQDNSSIKRAFSIHGGSGGGSPFTVYTHNGVGFVHGITVQATTGNVGIGITGVTSKGVSLCGGINDGDIWVTNYSTLRLILEDILIAVVRRKGIIIYIGGDAVINLSSVGTLFRW